MSVNSTYLAFCKAIISSVFLPALSISSIEFTESFNVSTASTFESLLNAANSSRFLIAPIIGIIPTISRPV